MSNFVEKLQRLNRKERFYLVGFALDRPDFQLGPEFREKVRSDLGFDVPEKAFVAMDYHISWLYAAAVLQEGDKPAFPAGGGIEKGNQEDVDLVIAYDEGSLTHLLILEAKGVTGWSNTQLASKVERLRAIFGDGSAPTRFPSLRPHFAIVSPIRPVQVKTSGWPEWMLKDDGQPAWMKMPAPADLLKITRCDASGKTGVGGGFWKAEPDRVSSRLARATEEAVGLKLNQPL